MDKCDLNNEYLSDVLEDPVHVVTDFAIDPEEAGLSASDPEWDQADQVIAIPIKQHQRPTRVPLFNSMEL